MGRPRKQAADYYVATEPFVTTIDGAPVSVPAGEPIPAGHPLLKGREDLFKPWETKFPLEAKQAELEPDPEEVAASDDTEMATAKPGEKRNR